MFKVRIESLSDLVFGLALSIGSISLINRTANNIDDVLYGLFWFAFSFVLVIAVWISYSRLLSLVRIETGWMLRLNIILLLLVTIEPYLLNLLAFANPSSSFPSAVDSYTTLYALDLGGLWLVIAIFYHLAIEQGREVEELTRHRNSLLLNAAIFLVSALPLFWTVTLFSIPLRYSMWFLSIAIERVFRYWPRKRS